MGRRGSRWGGPYPPQAWDADGNTVPWSDRNAAKRMVRWRFSDKNHRRRFNAKGAAETFAAKLRLAADSDWDADERGWPIDPADERAQQRAEASAVAGLDFRSFAHRWFEAKKHSWESNTRSLRAGHVDTASQWLVYQSPDEAADAARELAVAVGDRDPEARAEAAAAAAKARLEEADREAGDSILLAHLTADDLERALAVRRVTDLRTRQGNAAKLRKWEHRCAVEVAKAERGKREPRLPEPPVLAKERPSVRTVESFAIGLGMVVKAAQKAGHIPTDIWDAVEFEKSDGTVVEVRRLPSIPELLEVADAVGRRGGGKGARFRALIIVGATTGPRPGELAHAQPDDITWDGPDGAYITYYGSEGDVQAKHSRTGERRERRGLKARARGTGREVPLTDIAVDALQAHIDAGYASDEHLFTAIEGGPLRWRAFRDHYWRPALAAVFSESRPYLLSATPKMLRKAAITWWLRAGIDVYQAATYAGNSAEVIWESYAGVIDKSHATSRLKLQAALPPPTARAEGETA